tara:strand:+ start:3299 stop:4024 length:726 start_codon:yes stop_codon:yes gene_type:complete
MSTEIAVITKEELTKSENNMLTTGQLGFLLQKTPKNHIYQRPAKGGGNWNYVTGTYMKKVLNLMFGWDWSFEVVEHKFDITIGQAYVLGKLTVNSGGRSIVKMQFGRVDIKFKKVLAYDNDGKPIMAEDYNKKKYHKKVPSTLPLDLGNDLKAATTDALKKCAAELGIASDVYSPNEFKEIKIVDEKPKLSVEKQRITDMITDSKNQDDLDFIRSQPEAQTEEYLTLIKEKQTELNEQSKP